MSERPLQIVQVNAADAGGGAERSVMTLHLGLRALGHESTLYVGEKTLDAPGVVAIPYVRGFPGLRRLARHVESRSGWLDVYNPSFRSLATLIPHDVDVIHFHNLWGSAGYADWQALPGLTRTRPGVLTERQNWTFTGHCACFHDCMRWKTGCGQCPRLDIAPAIPRDGTAFNWRRRRRLIAQSRLTFVGISEHVCNLARQSPQWAGKRIVRIYNGIDTKTFCPVGDGDREALRRRLGLPADRMLVLLSGQTMAGFREGIATEGYEALNRLADPRVVPVLVGRSSSEARGFLAGPSIAVGFHETPEEMAEYYQASDLTLVTSKVEAFGRIAAESQACGTPVVAFDSGGLAEVVRDGVGGLAVRQGDVDGLTASLRRLLADPSERAQLALSGRAFVEEHFEEGLITRQYVRLYREVMSEAGTAPAA